MASSTVKYKLPDGRWAIDILVSKTLAATDQGIVQNVIVNGVTLTLPSTADGLSFTARNGGAAPTTGGPVGSGGDASVGFTLAPAAADAIAGNGFTAVVNKGAVNTLSTSKVGDEITVGGNGTAGVTAWNIDSQRLRGVFDRVA